MRSRGYERIVNIVSVAGKERNQIWLPTPHPNCSRWAYQINRKGGRKRGICINAVSPAMVERIPIKRTGQPEDVAAVVHFLAIRDCSFVPASAMT